MLIACGDGSGANNSILGTWKWVGAEYRGKHISLEDYYLKTTGSKEDIDEVPSLEFKEDYTEVGNGLVGISSMNRWKTIRDGKYILIDAHDENTILVKDGQLRLKDNYHNIVLIFERE